jgi:hypothetical protein
MTAAADAYPAPADVCTAAARCKTTIGGDGRSMLMLTVLRDIHRLTRKLLLMGLVLVLVPSMHGMCLVHGRCLTTKHLGACLVATSVI